MEKLVVAFRVDPGVKVAIPFSDQTICVVAGNLLVLYLRDKNAECFQHRDWLKLRKL